MTLIHQRLYPIQITVLNISTVDRKTHHWETTDRNALTHSLYQPQIPWERHVKIFRMFSVAQDLNLRIHVSNINVSVLCISCMAREMNQNPAIYGITMCVVRYFCMYESAVIDSNISISYLQLSYDFF